MRYTVHHDNGVHAVHDNGTPMGQLYTSRDAQTAQKIADNLNANASQPPVDPPHPGQATGWSKANGWRARRSHPLGEVVEVGDGYTVYEDTAFGGGRVQIWDNA